MDTVRLINEAREAGLSISMRGQRLIVRGPTEAEAFATQLLDNKETVMQILSKGSDGCGAQKKAIQIGHRVAWVSTKFGIRTGHVVMILRDGWTIVRSDTVVSNLTLLHQRDIHLSVIATIERPPNTIRRGKSHIERG